ncbi:hypothetical protein [Cereibacter sphaeroides]|nr:hypothetical protein [Cereibacter sphaeroides]
MSRLSDVRAGDLLLYPYLWSWEAGNGLRFADKVRPCVVVFRGTPDTPQEHKIILCAITSAEVRPPNFAVPIPPSVGQLAKINKPDCSRVVITECNIDDIATSSHLHPGSLIGTRVTDRFADDLAQRFRAAVRLNRMRQVQRASTLSEQEPSPY